MNTGPLASIVSQQQEGMLQSETVEQAKPSVEDLIAQHTQQGSPTGLKAGEARVLVSAAQEGNEAALDTLVNYHADLAEVYLVEAGAGDEARQMSNDAIRKAVDGFDTSSPSSFSVYVENCIRQECLTLMRGRELAHLPEDVAAIIPRVDRVMEALSYDSPEAPTREELIEAIKQDGLDTPDMETLELAVDSMLNPPPTISDRSARSLVDSPSRALQQEHPIDGPHKL